MMMLGFASAERTRDENLSQDYLAGGLRGCEGRLLSVRMAN